MVFSSGDRGLKRTASTYIAGTVTAYMLSSWSDDEDEYPRSYSSAHPRSSSSVTVATTSMPPTSEAHSVVPPDPLPPPTIEALSVPPATSSELGRATLPEMLTALRVDCHDILVRQMGRAVPWELWDSGVIDTCICRIIKANEKEGTIYRRAVGDSKNIIKQSRSCEFKVGIASVVSTRWRFYQAPDSDWRPSHMFVLAAVNNRSGACFLEAGIIHALELWECKDFPHNNLNKARQDTGGGGARWDSSEFAPHYVYLAVKVVKPLR